MTHITTERINEIIAAYEYDGGDRFDADIREALRELLQRRESDRWIPTSEAPTKHGQYLTAHEDGFAAISYFAGDTFYNNGEPQEPIAWRPLPEFKEEK